MAFKVSPTPTAARQDTAESDFQSELSQLELPTPMLPEYARGLSPTPAMLTIDDPVAARFRPSIVSSGPSYDVVPVAEPPSTPTVATTEKLLQEPPALRHLIDESEIQSEASQPVPPSLDEPEYCCGPNHAAETVTIVDPVVTTLTPVATGGTAS
eukprot:3941042-Rhodomonas_salina.2